VFPRRLLHFLGLHKISYTTVNGETVEKIVKNFSDERGVWIAPNKPYLSTAYIPYVDGFLDYRVKNDLGTLKRKNVGL